MSSNVKGYSDKQILDRVESIGGIIPNVGKYMIVGVQSNEDAYNLFDDKFYVFDGHEFKDVSTGTTNAGSTALKSFDKYNLPGAAVWRTDQFIKDCFRNGFHKGRMRALRQNKPIEFYRDSDKDNKAEQQGRLYKEIIWANMHGCDYDPYSEKIGTQIGGWSFGCQVWNRMTDYRNMINASWRRQKLVDYALLMEW